MRPDAQELLSGKEDVVFELLEREARAAVDNDGADTLILGSTTMHQSHSYLVSKLEVPILNPGLIALKVCENLVELGIAHVRRPTLVRKLLATMHFEYDNCHGLVRQMRRIWMK